MSVPLAIIHDGDSTTCHIISAVGGTTLVSGLCVLVGVCIYTGYLCSCSLCACVPVQIYIYVCVCVCVCGSALVFIL